MKPRLCVWYRAYDGIVWGCYSDINWVHIGKTPKEAYKKWASFEGVEHDPER